jgi:hypothetical protein
MQASVSDRKGPPVGWRLRLVLGAGFRFGHTVSLEGGRDYARNRRCRQLCSCGVFLPRRYVNNLHASPPITFFNRLTQRIETEAVYGEGFLRFSYESPLGALPLHALVKRAAFSRWYGNRMDAPASRAKVAPFLATYGVDVSEFADAPDSFRTFNEFFYRKLKPAGAPHRRR